MSCIVEGSLTMYDMIFKGYYRDTKALKSVDHAVNFSAKPFKSVTVTPTLFLT